MKKKLVFSIFTTILFFISCKNNLVSSALIENQSSGNSSRQISVPQDIRAIGGKRKIVLEWTESENATSYNIYAANTQFDEFQKIGTSTTTTFTYNASHSVTRYFKIVAENRYMQTTSAESLIVKGYTLAKPTITSIITETTDAGTETTVYWYMENVDDYQEYVRYEIICYDDSTQVTEMQVSGAETDLTYCVFENLPQNKNLQFEVNAYFTFAQSEIETSVKMDKKTAAMQTPKAAGGFSASNGTSPNEITLTFTLPEPSYIKVGSEDGENTFEQKALFFKIYRRLKDDSRADKKWGDEDLIVAHLYHDGTEEVTGVKPADAFFDNYNSGKLVTFTDDKNIAAGKKYEYKIQSYVDDCEEIITSEKTSVTYTSGWTCGLPSLRTDKFKYTYDNEENPAIKSTMKVSAVLDVKAAWENFGNEKLYKFILETTRYKIITDGENSKIATTPEPPKYDLFNSTDKIDAHEIEFELATYDEATSKYSCIERDSENNKEGQYKFKLYVVKADGAEATAKCAEGAIASVEAPGEILVIADFDLPKLTSFSAVGGYKDKVILKWKDEEISGLSYTLKRYTVDNKENTIPNSETTIDLPAITPENEEYTYTHDTDVNSGEKYYYTLVAKTASGLSVPSQAKEAITLGTPEPVFDNENPKLETITISWPQISKPKDDVVKYSVSLVDETDKKIEFDFNEEDVVPGSDEHFTYTISKPAGYNNANISGKDWKIVVEAKNTSKDNDTTTSAETIVKTLGPANLTAETTPSKSPTEIEVSWNTIPGTKRYAVVRSRYEVTDTSFTGEHSTNIYYVSPTGAVLSGGGDNVSGSVIATVEENKIILKDTYKENKNTNGTASDWDKDQDKLAWGFPYTYTVIPLDSETATVDDNGKIKNLELSYINLSSKRTIGSCKGYGHNVRATKAEDPYDITITWDEPYGIGENANKAKLFYKKGENGEWKNYAGSNSSEDSSTHKYSFTVTPSGEENPLTGTYYFAVGYEEKKPNDTYLSDATAKKDTVYSPTESLNKGYTYSLKLDFVPVLENNAPTLKEKFDWTRWDYSERAIGPDKDAKIELCLFNNDFVVVTAEDDGWRAIAEIDKNGNVKTYDKFTEDQKTKYKTDKYNVEFTKTESTGVIIKPKELKDADHPWYNGLLKVQRDYKHYAKLKCDRDVVDVNGNPVMIKDPNDNFKEIAKVAELSWADKNTQIFGYRNITDAELVRATMLILCQAVDDSTMNEQSDTGNNKVSNTTGIKEGSFEWSMEWRKWGKSNWYIGNFACLWPRLPGDLSSRSISSFLKLSDLNNASSGHRRFYKDEKTLHYMCYDKSVKFDANSLTTITVSPSSVCAVSSYGGTVKFAADKDTFNVEVYHGGDKPTFSKKITNSEDVKQWIPITFKSLSNNTQFLGESTTYDWWGE